MSQMWPKRLTGADRQAWGPCCVLGRADGEPIHFLGSRGPPAASSVLTQRAQGMEERCSGAQRKQGQARSQAQPPDGLFPALSTGFSLSPRACCWDYFRSLALW